MTATVSSLFSIKGFELPVVLDSSTDRLYNFIELSQGAHPVRAGFRPQGNLLSILDAGFQHASYGRHVGHLMV